jgi:prepilin-type N-terminal cleavage/methylation domain-containing protein
MKIKIRNPKSRNSDKCQVTGDKKITHTPLASCHVSRVTCHASAFTLVEMLLVITIIGILAALVIPKMVAAANRRA